MDQFNLQFETSRSSEDVLRDCLAVWTSQLAEHGYTLVSQSELGISYRRRYWHWYVILMAVLLFPIGLLFLLSRAEATITATVEATDDGGTSLAVTGLANNDVITAFEELQI